MIKKYLSKSFSKYDKICKDSITPGLREKFWDKESQEINWFRKHDHVLDGSNAPFYKWFKGGKINMTYNCIDRHILDGYGSNTALIWESAYLNMTKKFTYSEMQIEISKICKILIEKGLKPGDTAIIYMPMIPEAIFSFLACARLGVIHSVVFGGFAAEELADRIKNAEPKIIITASVGIEPKKQIPYYPIVRHSLEILNNPDIPILIVQRDSHIEKDIKNNTIIYNEEITKMDKTGYDIKPAEMESNDPLYILYTSGTTGTPKGIVRDIGGTCVALNYAMKMVMNINRGDVYFATSDIGWVVGHSFIVYGPLIRGATTICYEGKPIGTPHCGKFWEMVDNYKVKSIFTSPTALRAIKKEDSDLHKFNSYSLDSLESIHIAGERCDPDTINWVEKGVQHKKLINDNWWQTETGWQICSNNTLEPFPVLPGSAGKPIPGYDVRIYHQEDGQEITQPITLGNIHIKLPMPPSFMSTLWKNDKAFVEKYITKDNQYYITGDAGYFDENGFLHILTRVDDIINVAGHRLSTGRIEEVLCRVDDIVEAAVVGRYDEIKGETPFAFIVCKNSVNDYDLTKKKANEQIVEHIGAISKLGGVIVCHRLPKTRSGKILRGVLKKIINYEPYKVPPTIEDITALEEVIEELKIHNYLKNDE